MSTRASAKLLVVPLGETLYYAPDRIIHTRHLHGRAMRIDWKRLRLVPFAFLGVLGWMLVDYVIRGPEAKQKQIAIEKKIGAISDPKASNAISSGRGLKTSNGYVARIVHTDLDQDEVEAYYRGELEKGNWFYIKEEVILSNRRILYCNGGNESAILALPERGTAKTYEYSLTISWGIEYGCK